MSHCTKFNFSYTNEQAITKAFWKLGLKPTLGLVAEFNSDFSKKILGKVGYLGQRQFRAICAQAGRFNLMVCKIAENTYELMIERDAYSSDDDSHIDKLSNSFRRAYVSIAVDETLKRIENTGVSARIIEVDEGFKIEFGPNFEFGIFITISGDQILEEVMGVKGDVCTKLTEEIEFILAGPTEELSTEWKPEFTIVHEEQTLQILSANL